MSASQAGRRRFESGRPLLANLPTRLWLWRSIKKQQGMARPSLGIPFGLSPLRKICMNQTPESVFEMTLRGYGSNTCDAVVRVVSFGPSVRLRRALTGLGVAWVLAIVCLFIPIAHFFLVPGVLAFGAYLFVSRWRVRSSVKQAHGICPDCDARQEFQIGNWSPPHRVTCNACQRSLVLESSTDASETASHPRSSTST